jgi:hypothetical protein
MKPSSSGFNFAGGTQQQGQQQGAAGGHLSRISEDGCASFPAGGLVGDRAAGGRGSGESSSGGAAAAARSYSGGFSIVGPWEESRDIITTLGAYDPQVCMEDYTLFTHTKTHSYIRCNARSS